MYCMWYISELFTQMYKVCVWEKVNNSSPHHWHCYLFKCVVKYGTIKTKSLLSYIHIHTNPSTLSVNGRLLDHANLDIYQYIIHPSVRFWQFLSHALIFCLLFSFEHYSFLSEYNVCTHLFPQNGQMLSQFILSQFIIIS